MSKRGRKEKLLSAVFVNDDGEFDSFLPAFHSTRSNSTTAYKLLWSYPYSDARRRGVHRSTFIPSQPLLSSCSPLLLVQLFISSTSISYSLISSTSTITECSFPTRMESVKLANRNVLVTKQSTRKDSRLVRTQNT